MKHYAGLDVSIKETSVCVLDEDGRIVREVKVPSHPEDLADALTDPAHPLDRVGLEAGPLSQWLFSGLAEKGVPVVCIETRHSRALVAGIREEPLDEREAPGDAVEDQCGAVAILYAGGGGHSTSRQLLGQALRFCKDDLASSCYFKLSPATHCEMLFRMRFTYL